MDYSLHRGYSRRRLMKSVPPLAHPHSFDPTYGYDLDRLLTVPAPEGPSDFADFWRRTYAEALATPLNLVSRDVDCPYDDFDLYEVEFDSLGGVRIGGWITVPKDYDRANGGWVVGHGYGGRSEPDREMPPPSGPAIFFCARGFHRSEHPTIPNTAAWHVLHGIEDRETYVHRGCTADIWAAASALIEMFPDAARDLRYMGASFGGGIGALALPWDARFAKGMLDFPSFGNIPLRIQLPCVGSGEAVRLYHRRNHPEVLRVLAYFDAATAARYMKIPIFVTAALFDPAVPPPGQFAIYNGLSSLKTLFVRTSAHFGSPNDENEHREIRRLLAKWFRPGVPASLWNGKVWF